MNKFILKSKTIWGIIIAVAPVVFPAVSAIELNNLATAAVSLVGAALAVYGRFKAIDPIRL
jgi:hypothetical protein